MSASLLSGGYTLLLFALVISVVVFFHELGHLLVGKALGVKAVRFSLGFGPRLFAVQLGETEFRLSALPLGGYVKFAGDNPYEEVAAEDRGRGFLEQAPWKRALIAFAGPAANFVLAAVVAAFLAASPHHEAPAKVGTVEPGSPAELAGLRAGDRIASVDGEVINSWSELQERIRAHAGQALDLVVERQAALRTVRVVPAVRQENGPIETVRYGRLGILAAARKPELALESPDAPLARAGLRTFDLVAAVNGVHVSTWDDLVSALESAPGPVQLQAIRREPVEAPGGTLWREVPVSATLARGGPPAQLGLATLELTLFAVQPGGAAAEAGLRRGDRIVAVAGKPVKSWLDGVDEPLRAAGAAPVAIAVVRDGQPLSFEVRQHLRRQRDETGVRVEVPELGATPELALLPPDDILTPWTLSGVPRGVRIAFDGVRAQVLGIARILTGRISSEAIGGPLMIADVARQAAEQGWRVLLSIIMAISIALGVMNLLPVPVLDGFHVVSAAIEAVRRRPLSLRFREVSNAVGIALLLALMVFAFRNDAMRKWFE